MDFGIKDALVIPTVMCRTRIGTLIIVSSNLTGTILIIPTVNFVLASKFLFKKSSLFELFRFKRFHPVKTIFDSSFIFDSYSSRVGKGTHLAVKKLADKCRKLSKNYTTEVWALKGDVKKFFDSIDQTILIKLLENKISDQDALELVKVIINSFNSIPGKGLPLGNVTSQLFANVYLNELDQFVKRDIKAKNYLRYADDFIILGQNSNELNELIYSISDFLSNNLKLELHPEKVFVRKLNHGLDFLGYVVRPHHVVLRTKTKRRMIRKMKNNVNNQSLQSYLGILKHCRGKCIERSLKAFFV